MSLVRSYFTGCFKILCQPIFLMLGLATLIVASDTRANEHYLRFGFGLDHPETSYFHDAYCKEGPGEQLLYGCTTGPDGFPVRRSVGNFGNVPVVEFGIGYPNGRSRWELLIEYRPSFDFSGNATYGEGDFEQVASAKNISSLAGMVAGYIDFNDGKNSKAVPFVGAGIGIARNRMNDFQIRFRRTTTTIPGAEKNKSGLEDNCWNWV